MPSTRRQLALQLAAVLLVLSFAWPYYLVVDRPLDWPVVVAAIGATALVFATVSRQPWWWRLIHAGFAPLAWLVSGLEVDPGWFLLAFILMLLIYRGAVTEQVPLYLSNRATAATLAGLLPAERPSRLIDLGAGVGSLLRPLSELRPQCELIGVENAPLTWLIGRLRTASLARCQWRWGDLWQADLAGCDVVYAFLSPAPMASLAAKCALELPEGALLVSNSFAIPGIDPWQTLAVANDEGRALYCYRKQDLQPILTVATSEPEGDNPDTPSA